MSAPATTSTIWKTIRFIPFTHRESEFYMNRPPEIPDITVEESDWGCC